MAQAEAECRKDQGAFADLRHRKAGPETQSAY
jgi:hypothetical protein